MSKFAYTSYSEEDCRFLLKPIDMEFTKIEEKERLIQLGIAHYSETVSKEEAPTKEYVDLFFKLTGIYKHRLAKEILILSKMIETNVEGSVCLLSLARAGTPIGVLINRAFKLYSEYNAEHYSISIIRDKGIDFNALDYLIYDLGINPSSIVFIDGWTAKGVITQELKKSVNEYNRSRNVNISNDLYVVSDIGATAAYSATTDDYTIPSALMNSTVSGLVSRSIHNHQIGEDDFHGCVSYRYLQEHDYSNWFVDEIATCFQKEEFVFSKNPSESHQSLNFRRYIERVMKEYNVTNINRVKPGIAESTRVMLRRVPDILIVRDLDDVNVSHLLQIATEKRVKVVVKNSMPFGACALIRDVIS